MPPSFKIFPAAFSFCANSSTDANNLESYLNCNKIVACGGSWMVKGDLIKAGEFDKIKDLTLEAVALAKSTLIFFYRIPFLSK